MSAEIETLHKPFRAFLDKLRGQVCYTYHRPDRATGATLGDADFVLYSFGSCLHIEFKTKTGRLSAVQKRRHAELAAVGVIVHVCRDLAAAISLVVQWRGAVAEFAVAPAKVAPGDEVKYWNGVRLVRKVGEKQFKVAKP